MRGLSINIFPSSDSRLGKISQELFSNITFLGYFISFGYKYCKSVKSTKINCMIYMKLMDLLRYFSLLLKLFKDSNCSRTILSLPEFHVTSGVQSILLVAMVNCLMGSCKTHVPSTRYRTTFVSSFGFFVCTGTHRVFSYARFSIGRLFRRNFLTKQFVTAFGDSHQESLHV